GAQATGGGQGRDPRKRGEPGLLLRQVLPPAALPARRRRCRAEPGVARAGRLIRRKFSPGARDPHPREAGSVTYVTVLAAESVKKRLLIRAFSLATKPMEEFHGC